MKRKTREEYLHLVTIGTMTIFEVPHKYVNYTMCLAGVTVMGFQLGDVPEQYRDYDMGLAAVTNSAKAIRWIPDKYHTFELLCIYLSKAFDRKKFSVALLTTNELEFIELKYGL